MKKNVAIFLVVLCACGFIISIIILFNNGSAVQVKDRANPNINTHTINAQLTTMDGAIASANHALSQSQAFPVVQPPAHNPALMVQFYQNQLHQVNQFNEAKKNNAMAQINVLKTQIENLKKQVESLTQALVTPQASKPANNNTILATLGAIVTFAGTVFTLYFQIRKGNLELVKMRVEIEGMRKKNAAG
jgi:preprotein translocase subunit SecF